MKTNPRAEPDTLTDQEIGKFRRSLPDKDSKLRFDCLVAVGAKPSDRRGGKREARQRIADAINARTQNDEKAIKKKPGRRDPAWIKQVNPKAFASLDAARPREEAMIHVYWSGLGDARDARDGGRGHLMQRDKVTANLGLDRAPDPGFTDNEMQQIAFAAKMAALKCLRLRVKNSKSAL